MPLKYRIVPHFETFTQRFQDRVQPIYPCQCIPRNAKVMKVYVGEVNPPYCRYRKVTKPGGPCGTVSIAFADVDAMRRICPPKMCNCPFKEMQPNQFFMLMWRLAKLATFLTAIYISYCFGIWGTPMETQRLADCYKHAAEDCRDPNPIRRRKKRIDEITLVEFWNYFVQNIGTAAYISHGVIYKKVREIIEYKMTFELPVKHSTAKKEKEKEKKRNDIFDKVLEGPVSCPSDRW